MDGRAEVGNAANKAAERTDRTRGDAIPSIDELVNQNEIKWLVKAGGSFIIRGRESKEGTVLK